MPNINVELKGPKGPQIKESLLPTAVAGYTRGLAVIYGADEYHAKLPTAAGAPIVGLIEEDAISLLNPISVIEHGQAAAQIGATVAPGQWLTANAAGQLIPAAMGNTIVAFSLSGNANAGDYITVLVTGAGAVHA